MIKIKYLNLCLIKTKYSENKQLSVDNYLAYFIVCYLWVINKNSKNI